MRRRIQALTLLALAGSLVIGVAGASGAEIQQYQSSFVGTGSTQGSFSPGGISQIAVDHATGSVYVTDAEKGVIDKFDALGNPVEFSALGTTTLAAGGSPFMVNNTGTGSQGNLYLKGGGQIRGFNPDGTAIGPNFPLTFPVEGFSYCSFAIAPSGNLWAFPEEPDFFAAEEFTADGTNTGAQPPLHTCSGYSAFDQAGNFYVPGSKLDASNGYAPVEPSPFIVGQPFMGPVAINPLNQDVYFSLRENFLTLEDRIVAFHPSDEPSEPFEVLTGFHGVRGLAFGADGSLYVTEAGTFGVANSAKVDIFHPGPSGPPIVKREAATNVRTTFAEFGAEEVRANGSSTSFRAEYGADSSYGSATPSVDLGSSVFPHKDVRTPKVEGLAPNTTYHYRLAVTNSEGTTYTPDHVFTTFPMPSGGVDSCPNALARKQTGARDLPDCRAYELVSARDSGGYDVESSLIAGQTPFGGYPLAKGRVLYATHSGAVPGPWHATNKGPDPYLASRGPNGWSTDYLGLPSDINPAAGPFSSVLGEADASLDTLAFAGAGLCGPCFEQGIETGIPLRLPSGQLVQGMAGSLDPGVASAMPEGRVAKYFSVDGKHLVFASKYAFEPGANDNGSDLTIYDRDLSEGGTQIVSTTTSGATMTGAGISELDISSDGSRIVFAQKVSSDSAGNEYVHPYLHIAGSPDSVDLAPTTTSGVLYDGMSADASKLFFTTTDALLGDDTDSSADIYEAEVDVSGNVTLSLVSAGNATICNPVANSARAHWNSVTGSPDCGAVAIGGGGGVASESADVYFLSPELLDGTEGTLDQPNLYRAAPGETPVFIATLEPDNPLVLDSVGATAKRQTGEFQVNPSGNNAVFTSKLGLTENDPTGDAQVFRYSATAGGSLECSSCSPTNGLSPGAAGDATLAPNGLSLADDGRVFFTTPVPLVLSDTGNRKDVYESSGGPARLISSGISPFDSGLLSVSADGTDAYFFTHDRLAAAEDREGTLTRIYDARERGGFFAIPGPAACAAADECHGPGTQNAPAPPIRTGGPTTDGNQQPKPPLSCRKGQAKKRGRCVAKKRHAKKQHTTKSQSRGSHKHA